MSHEVPPPPSHPSVGSSGIEGEVENIESFRQREPETFRQYLARRRMVFVVAYVGYVCAYLVRNNFKLQSEAIRIANGWSLADVGLILTGFTISYGIGKFVMGIVVDNVSLRRIFAAALAASSLLAFVMGVVSQVWLLFLLMLCLGMVQGVLSPGSQSMIANWYPNRSRGAGIAVWNTSQNVGGALLPLILVWVATWGGASTIKLGFWVPGAMVLLLSFFFWKYGGDRLDAEGLPTLRAMYGRVGEPMAEEPVEGSQWQIMVKYVFTSRIIITIGLVNAILYFVRFGVTNWMPAFLGTEMGFTEEQYLTAFSALELIAIPGSFLFAWVAVKLPNRQTLVGAIGLLVLAGLVFTYMGVTSYPLLIAISGLMGALIYGPQLIVNILTLNFVPLKAAGAAVGFVGLFGYIVGELAANVLMPIFAEHMSWTFAFTFVSVSAVIAAVLYLSLTQKEKEVVAT